MKIKNFIFTIVSLFFCTVFAKATDFEIKLSNHLFYPATIHIPPYKKVRLIIENQDEKPELFESFDLNREKMLFPDKKNIIFVGPLAPGTYGFHGEFNADTAQGIVVVLDNKDDQ